MEPLGWVDDRHAVALVTRTSDVERHSGWSSRDRELALVDPASGAVTVVGEVDMGVPPSLTVATDLMTLDRPTAERPRPDWPGIDGPEGWPLAALAGAGLLVLAAYVVVRRRSAGRS